VYRTEHAPRVSFTVEPRSFAWGDPVDLTIVVDAN
jgi:hypothetical protein